MLLDASQIAVGSGELEMDASRNAALQMTDAPTEGAQPLESLFQTNAVALRIQREVAYAKLRSTAVAAIENTQRVVSDMSDDDWTTWVPRASTRSSKRLAVRVRVRSKTAVRSRPILCASSAASSRVFVKATADRLPETKPRYRVTAGTGRPW